MSCAYLDVSGNVLATSETVVEIIDLKVVGVTERIENAPSGLNVKDLVHLGADSYHQKISGDGSDISHYTEITDTIALDDYKRSRGGQIDGKTYLLITAGFTYDSETFSCSPTAQMLWVGLKADAANLTYPYSKTVKDDTKAPYDFALQSDLEAAYTALVAHVNTHISSGQSLKGSIRAAADKASVDAIVDNR